MRTDGQLSKSRISNYEQGIRRMSLEAASQLASALESVTPAWLLLLDEFEPLLEEERGLIEGFRAMDKARRRQLLDLLDGSRTPEDPPIISHEARKLIPRQEPQGPH